MKRLANWIAEWTIVGLAWMFAMYFEIKDKFMEDRTPIQGYL